MPRLPKRPHRKRPFRLQVIVDGAVVADLDAAAVRLSTPNHTLTRSDTVRRALREFVCALKETP